MYDNGNESPTLWTYVSNDKKFPFSMFQHLNQHRSHGPMHTWVILMHSKTIPDLRSVFTMMGVVIFTF